MSEGLDVFGRLLTTQLRDEGIDFAQMAIAAKWKAPSLQALQQELLRLAPEHRQTVVACVRAAIDHGIHEFLVGLQAHCDNGELAILHKGVDIASDSDGLQGEPFTSDGWYSRFSKYGED